MAYLNQLAIGCEKNVYDEYTAWYSNHYRIINGVSALQPYIDIRAKEENYDKNSRPCGYLRAMAYRWRNKIGRCEKWERQENRNSKKVREEIEEWKKKYK